MPAGTCQGCGAPETRCAGLCGRCYYARRRERPAGSLPARDGRASERAWDAAQVVTALVVELPEPGRHLGASWAARGACRDHRDLPWHQGRRRTAEMRAVCAACQVRADCLAEALADPAADGIWAGTTPTDRVALRAAPP